MRPDLLLWVQNALLLKAEEKNEVGKLPVARSEIVSKMTNAWDDKVYGTCLYMFAYAVAGNQLELYAVQ